MFWPCPSLNGWVAIAGTLWGQACIQVSGHFFAGFIAAGPIWPSQVQLCVVLSLKNQVGTGCSSGFNDIQYSGVGVPMPCLLGFPQAAVVYPTWVLLYHQLQAKLSYTVILLCCM